MNMLLLQRLAAVDVVLMERNRRWRRFADVVEPLCEQCYLHILRDGAPGPHSWGCPAYAGPGPVAKSTGASIAMRRAAARAMMLATSPTPTPKSTPLDVVPEECSEDTDGAPADAHPPAPSEITASKGCIAAPGPAARRDRGRPAEEHSCPRMGFVFRL